MMDVFVVRDPSCSLVSTARPLIASSVPSYNSGSTLLLLVTSHSSYGLIAGSWLRLEASVLPYWPAVISSIRRMTSRVQVFLEFFYWLSLKFAKAPGPLCGVEGRRPWRWWPGCMFQQYIRCCPFLPVVGCLLTLKGATPRRGGQLPRGEIRLQEEVLCRDPLAQRGRFSGLTKDKLNSVEG